MAARRCTTWRRPSLTDPARGGPMRPRVGTKGWAPLEVEQKDEKDKKERKKDAVVQNWCLTSRVPYKEGDESEQDRNHATRGYGHGPRKLRLPRCFHNFEQGQRRC